MTTSDYIQRLERLLEVSRNLSTNLDLEPFLQSIVDVASELTLSQEASILTYDDQGGYLKFVAGPWYYLDTFKLIKVPVDQSVAGWVYTNNQALAIHEAVNDKRIYRDVDRLLHRETQSILAVPIVFKGQPVGVLEIVNKTGAAHFTEEDVTFLEILASQAAVAIQNSRLLEKSQQAFQQLIELDRMKTDFIAIISHELRTPLGLILGYATFLRESITPDQTQQMDIILRNAMRLKEIIEEFSNIDNFKTGMARVRSHEVAIDRLIQEVVLAFQGLSHDQKISLMTEFPRENLMIVGDAEKIGIALSNLVKNALTFTNPGGHVLITAEKIPGFIKVSVIDDGIGIPPIDIRHIFERFFQVESHLTRRHGGMGLGLSIARDMIEMHGGRIWVESVEGKGSNFSFLLPSTPSQINAAQKVFQS